MAESGGQIQNSADGRAASEPSMGSVYHRATGHPSTSATIPREVSEAEKVLS